MACIKALNTASFKQLVTKLQSSKSGRERKMWIFVENAICFQQWAVKQINPDTFWLLPELLRAQNLHGLWLELGPMNDITFIGPGSFKNIFLKHGSSLTHLKSEWAYRASFLRHMIVLKIGLLRYKSEPYRLAKYDGQHTSRLTQQPRVRFLTFQN